MIGRYTATYQLTNHRREFGGVKSWNSVEQIHRPVTMDDYRLTEESDSFAEASILWQQYVAHLLTLYHHKADTDVPPIF